MAGRFAAVYELQGMRGFEAALEKASAAVRREVELANRETAYAIQRRAKSLAPRDRGDLIANIAVQGKGYNWQIGLLDVSLPSRGGSNTAHLNPWVYGIWYEFGFRTRKIAAHPFMKPAAAAEQPVHEARLQRATGAIERAAA